jgi:hypothetical protein
MDEALLAAYRATTYRVRLARGGWAGIRIDQPLPSDLSVLARTLPWGYLTAWNPYSELLPRPRNRVAQHALLAALHALPETVAAIHPGMGVSRNSQWKEQSLWVVGPGVTTLDSLARHFGQWAYVHGEGDSPAQLRLTPAA